MTVATTPPADPAVVVDPADEPDTTEDDPEAVDPEAAADDAKPDEQVGREAARYRRRLRDAEAANEALAADHAAELASAETAHAATTEVLTRQREAIMAATLERAGLDPRLAAAAGITTGSVLGEDGLIDATKLAEAVRSAVAEFGVTPRTKGPTPNRQQGSISTGKSETSWAKVLGGYR
ncbi:hypothetical protein [Mycolicibacterium sp. A43C]